MTPKSEILLEGTYFYYQKDLNYSQENFKFVQNADHSAFHVYAEILSRIETGDFLKLIVHYEMNQNFIPVFVRIEKSIGNKYAQETYKYDIHTQELNYTFQEPNHSQEFKKSHSSKHYLTSPAISTSALFTLSRKFDATGRTPVTFVNSPNEWTYQGPPTDKILFAEIQNREVSDFKLNGQHLAASHLCLYEHDSTHSQQDKPLEIFMSKHYSLPYQVTHGDLKMVIKNLKRNN